MPKMSLAFNERFKGRINIMDKSGEIGMVSQASRPIEKINKPLQRSNTININEEYAYR